MKLILLTHVSGKSKSYYFTWNTEPDFTRKGRSFCNAKYWFWYTRLFQDVERTQTEFSLTYNRANKDGKRIGFVSIDGYPRRRWNVHRSFVTLK